MTRLEALKELAKKVEDGDTPYAHQIIMAIGKDYDEGVACVSLVRLACYPDDLRAMGAAMALHEAVLPGCKVSIHDRGNDNAGVARWAVKVNWEHMEWEPTFTAAGPFGHTATAENPSRAWLSAILQYLIAQEESK
jgi:hypothetical protein